MTRVLCVLGALVLAAGSWNSGPARAAAGIGDILPYRLIHGRPDFSSDEEAEIFVWSEGGRLKLRVRPRSHSSKVEGTFRVDQGGIFRDVRPNSEDVRIRQPSQSVLSFDLELPAETQEPGLDVAVAGDFATLYIDFTLDGVRRPTAVAIGGRRQRPVALPAQLNLEDGPGDWYQQLPFE